VQVLDDWLQLVHYGMLEQGKHEDAFARKYPLLQLKQSVPL
jgi:hypothetical protein